MLAAKELEEHIQAPIEEQLPKKTKAKKNKTGEIATSSPNSRNNDTPSLLEKSQSNPNNEIATNAEHSHNDEGASSHASEVSNDEKRNSRKTIFFNCVHLVYVGEREYLLSNTKGERVKLQKGDEIILPKGDTERYLLYKGLFKRVWSDS